MRSAGRPPATPFLAVELAAGVVVVFALLARRPVGSASLSPQLSGDSPRLRLLARVGCSGLGLTAFAGVEAGFVEDGGAVVRWRLED